MSSVFGAVALSKRYMEMDYTPRFDGYSGVEIIYSENEEDAPYFAGDRTGRVLTVQNPWGTQAQAENILAKIRGYQYQPFTTTNAMLDPAAEIGDGISTRGFYAGLHKIDRDFSALMATNIAAPQDEELDHEYPYESKTNREITRKFTQVESSLSLQSSEIEARVTKTGGNNSSFGWKLESDGFSLHSSGAEVFKVDQNGANVKGVIKATSGEIGGFMIGNKSGQTAIYYNIPDFANKGGITNGVYLGTDGIRLGNTFTVDVGGNITMEGTLKIGDNTITANDLRSGAQSAVNNGGYWSSGAGYGFNFNSATKASGGSYPSHFQANTLKCTYLSTTSIGCSGKIECQTLYVNGRQVIPT